MRVPSIFQHCSTLCPVSDPRHLTVNQMRFHRLVALSLALQAAALLGAGAIESKSDAECKRELQAAATEGNCTESACPDSCAIELSQVCARRRRRPHRQLVTTGGGRQARTRLVLPSALPLHRCQ